jgi:hypothetical protein
MRIFLCVAVALSAQMFGGVGEMKRVDGLTEGGDEHKEFFKLLSEDAVASKLREELGEDAQPVEYATQVVAGLKYFVTMKRRDNELYQVQIWSKPFNSALNQLPPPEVVKVMKMANLGEL